MGSRGTNDQDSQESLNWVSLQNIVRLLYKIDVSMNELTRALSESKSFIKAGELSAPQIHLPSDPAELDDLLGGLDVKIVKSGLTGAEVAILFAPLAIDILSDIWKVLILPHLHQKLGRNALRESTSDTEPTSS